MFYPHESFAELSKNVASADCEIYDQLLEMGRASLLINLGEKAIFGANGTTMWQEGAARQFELFNGHRQGVELVYKDAFPGIINAIGYRAPSTTVLDPGMSDTEKLAQINALDFDSPFRFLKPLAGSRSKGVKRAASPEEALTIAEATKRPYLVQSYEKPQEEWRYALHRDPQQVLDGGSPKWRVAMRKFKGEVIGNGYNTVPDLVRSSDLPRRAKRNFLALQDKRELSIPPRDEIITVQSGSILNATLPTQPQLKKLDAFFTDFIGKLERHIGASLVTACFDFGLIDAAKLNDKNNIVPLTADDVVFYEYQVPFGGYNLILAQKVYPHNKSLGRKVSRTFSRSMFVGGKLVRQK
jgi:hypothetical protein